MSAAKCKSKQSSARGNSKQLSAEDSRIESECAWGSGAGRKWVIFSGQKVHGELDEILPNIVLDCD